MHRLLAVFAASLAAAVAAEPLPSSVATANRTLQIAGLPAIPTSAREVRCYSFTGLSAGIYAKFVLKEPDFSAFLQSFSAGLSATSPIPASLLPPPNPAASWFNPASIKNGTVHSRGRMLGASPELVRLYVDRKNFRLFLYYQWNNKRTYP